MKLFSVLFIIGMMYLSYRVVRFLLFDVFRKTDPQRNGQRLCMEYISRVKRVLNNPKVHIGELIALRDEGEKLIWVSRQEAMDVSIAILESLEIIHQMLGLYITQLQKP